MTAQEYLDSNIEELKNFIKIRNERMMQLDELFKKKGAKKETDVSEILKKGELSNEDLEDYYATSVLNNDTSVLSRKVCDFIHFNKALGVELDLKEINEINGFTAFIRDYKPYETNFILTPENQTKEANIELYKEGKEAFKKTMRNKGIMELINEGRN